MSIYTEKTGLSSILKKYEPSQREKAKNEVINKVRFEMPRQQNLLEIVQQFQENGNEVNLRNFISYIGQSNLEDEDFEKLVGDAILIMKKLLNERLSDLVEALLCLNWVNRPPKLQQLFADFCIDILVSENRFLPKFIKNLIQLWRPDDNEAESWLNNTPSDCKLKELEAVHKLLDRILTIIPMSFNIVMDTIMKIYPYYKKPIHVYVGFLYNLLWFLKYKPIFCESLLFCILGRLIHLDINIPRSEIEDLDSDDDDSDDEIEKADETMFQMDDLNSNSTSNPLVQTLDQSLEMLYQFLETRNPYSPNLTEIQRQNSIQFSNALFEVFNREILQYYNTHHVQFVWFYYCSFKPVLAENFLSSLWHKIQNPNVPSVIRQTAVGYLASFLARANFISISTLQYYLKELANWAHNYIQNCDQFRSNISLKSNLVFYTICQAIFYMIAFRSRSLTDNKKGLLFLQSLHLPGLVTCNLNPLRVCLPAVATAFAGVTRTYQLAYCHAILERNARRKLATVYGNECETPEEVLDTFFPFDPYLLKNSKKRIEPLYLQYQASDAEEHSTSPKNSISHSRKRGDSEMIDETEIDDFLIADKRQRLHEREAQFTYGLSPGFHT